MSLQTIARTAPQTSDAKLPTWHCVDFERPDRYLCGRKVEEGHGDGHLGIPDGEKCVVCLGVALSRGLS